LFVTKSALELFHISKNVVDDLKVELAESRAENRQLKDELAAIKANNDWFRVKCNQLELERAQLLEKAYGVRVPVPEITRSTPPMLHLDAALFEDIGDKQAKELGLPVYSN
jgi:hypothetical protein